jgi:DinB superfamily
MGAWSELLEELESMPQELERTLQVIPNDRLRWKPESWGGAPGETFSALEHVCHLRDIERDGYQVRLRRLLDEDDPSLASLDGYEIARQRRYQAADLAGVLSEFRQARAETLAHLRGLSDAQLARAGEFAEYGRLTLRALIHYLRSHDQQHLAGLHWLAGKAASEG